MAKKIDSLYVIERYVRCGAMPLFLIFCKDRRGLEHYCIMLCTQRKLRELTHLRRGFSNPALYGRVVCSGFGAEPAETVRDMLKARYDFDYALAAENAIRLL